MTAPPPIPVPSVRYTKDLRPRAAPQRPSASAAALTSVSNPTGTPKAATNGPTSGVPDQPALGVVVIDPYCGWPGRSSTGPNEPIPIASSRLPFAMARRKKSIVAVERLVRAGRLEAQRLDDLARSGADDAHELGPAGLYPAEHPALSTRTSAKHRLQSRSFTATPAHGGPTGGRGALVRAACRASLRWSRRTIARRLDDDRVDRDLGHRAPALHHRTARRGWVKGRRLANRSGLAERRDPVRTAIASDAGVGHP